MRCGFVLFLLFFFFNDTATTEIYTLSLHDALPICRDGRSKSPVWRAYCAAVSQCRSEEHTSELQSRLHLLCRLLLEKKKKKTNTLLNSFIEPSATRGARTVSDT